MISKNLFLPPKNPPNMSFRFGTIGAVDSHSATVVFDGEETNSGKYYKCLQNYTPTADDRVIIAWQSGTGVILGNF